MASDSTRAWRILALGLAAASLSGVGTYYYLVSILLYPALWGIYVGANKDVAHLPMPLPAKASYGVSLCVAALLMPAAGAIGYAFFLWLSTPNPGGSGAGGAPLFYAVYVPPAVVLAGSLLVAWLRRAVWARRAGRVGNRA